MQPTIRIIDNKKISLTQAEWDLYNSICRSYDRPHFKGEELFKNLFETDENGVIIFLKPPSTKYTSIEVFLFVTSLMVHQHMRQMYSEVRGLMKQAQSQLDELKLLKNSGG